MHTELELCTPAAFEFLLSFVIVVDSSELRYKYLEAVKAADDASFLKLS